MSGSVSNCSEKYSIFRSTFETETFSLSASFIILDARKSFAAIAFRNSAGGFAFDMFHRPRTRATLSTNKWTQHAPRP